jgi:hypothetical protein
MHKLAILQVSTLCLPCIATPTNTRVQASIEYVRYLEDCVSKLKAQCGSEAKLDPEPRPVQSGLPSPTLGDAYNHNHGYGAGAPDACSPDVDMTSSSSAAPSPSFTPIASRSQQPSISPALRPQDPGRHNSYSSVSSEYRLHSYSTSTTTSPFFGPQGGGGYPDASQQHAHSAYGSALTSPALPPQRDLDQEATTALLMLNQMDRRTSSTAAPRGMSVRDLLSS